MNACACARDTSPCHQNHVKHTRTVISRRGWTLARYGKTAANFKNCQSRNLENAHFFSHVAPARSAAGCSPTLHLRRNRASPLQCIIQSVTGAQTTLRLNSCKTCSHTCPKSLLMNLDDRGPYCGPNARHACLRSHRQRLTGKSLFHSNTIAHCHQANDRFRKNKSHVLATTLRALTLVGGIRHPQRARHNCSVAGWLAGPKLAPEDGSQNRFPQTVLHGRGRLGRSENVDHISGALL